MTIDFPPKGRLAGVDFGTRRIGLALSDPGRTIASPFKTYTRRSVEQDAEFFRQFAAAEDIVGFVVGLPLHMSGDESAMAAEARQFGSWLADVTGLAVRFYDERLSTAAANEFLAVGNLTAKQRKRRRDMLAAQVILTTFLDSEQATSDEGPIDE